MSKPIANVVGFDDAPFAYEHRGDIRLVEGTIGATFRVTIPDRAVELKARRGERARA